MEQAEGQLTSERKYWPELKGKTYEEAAKVIKEQCPELNVQRVPENSMVTMDYRPDRVRVYVNDSDVVLTVPSTG